jgi:nitrate/TMAO reductase-like tetraheme cytochrome c subunit
VQSTSDDARWQGRLWFALAGVLPVVCPRFLFADEAVRDFQYDPVEHWAARFLAYVLIVTIVVVCYLLFRAYRGRLTGVTGKGLLLVGVVLLPSFSVATGTLLVFIRAERVEFCASCHHVMQAYADDMIDPASSGLAAVHFTNQYIPTDQCYECHTSYGLFGTVEAKMHGVVEVLRYYTGTYKTPIRTWKPYSNSDCLKCHARSKKWLSLDAHSDEEIKNELFEDTTSCMSCHDTAHKVPESMGAEES